MPPGNKKGRVENVKKGLIIRNPDGTPVDTSAPKKEQPKPKSKKK